MARTYPYGYAGTRLTLTQLEAKASIRRLHPEFWRRTLALMDAAADAAVDLGVGTGWRVQPDPPPAGFAKPGNSNHEGFPVGPTSTGAVAADMVPAEAWPWMEANVARFGLKTFRKVNSEPWHIQPAEIPNSRNWRTEPWKLAEFPLPTDPQPPPLEDDEMIYLVGPYDDKSFHYVPEELTLTPMAGWQVAALLEIATEHGNRNRFMIVAPGILPLDKVEDARVSGDSAINT